MKSPGGSYQIKLILDGHAEKRVLFEDSCVVGRDSRCDFQIDHKVVSRRHAEFKVASGLITVEDLGSSNGTMIDGSRLYPRQQYSLQPGSMVSLGSGNHVVLLVTRVEAEAEGEGEGEGDAEAPSPDEEEEGSKVVLPFKPEAKPEAKPAPKSEDVKESVRLEKPPGFERGVLPPPSLARGPSGPTEEEFNQELLWLDSKVRVERKKLAKLESEYRAALERFEGQKSFFESDLASLKGTIDGLSREAQARRDEIERAEAEISAAHERARGHEAEIQRKKEQLAEEIKTLKEQSIAAHRTFGLIDEQLREAKEEAQAEIQQIREQVRKRKTELETAEAEARLQTLQHESKIEELKSRKAAAERDLHLEEMRRAKILASAEEALTQAEQAAVAAWERATQLTREAEQRIQEAQAAMERRDSAFKEVEGLNEEARSLQQALVLAQAENQKAYQELEELRRQSAVLAQKHQNEARQLIESARAQADQIRVDAETEARASIETAQTEARELLARTQVEAEELRAEAERNRAQAFSDVEQARAAAKAEFEQLRSSALSEAELIRDSAKSEAEQLRSQTKLESDEVLARAIRETQETLQLHRESLRNDALAGAQRLEVELSRKRLAEEERIQQLIREEKRKLATGRRHQAEEIARKALEFAERGSFASQLTSFRDFIVATLEGSTAAEASAEAAEKTRRFWKKAAIRSAVAVLPIIIWFAVPSIPRSIKSSVERTVASEKKEEGGVFLDQIRQRGMKYQPPQDKTFRDSYTDNILYLEGYADFKSDSKSQEAWTLALNRFFTQDLSLDDRVVVGMVSSEAVMFKELMSLRANITEQLKDYGIQRMRDTEKTEAEKLKKLLRSPANYEKFRAFEKKFFEEHRKQ